jgi:hypothetical protein
VPAQAFARFLNKHAWRIRAKGPEKLPLGSFRLQVPGNPVAINAALCSGRFPGVFQPYPLKDLYPPSDPDNALLYRLLEGWLGDAAAEAELKPRFQALNPGRTQGEGEWGDWRQSASMRAFFPRAGDGYVDGGAIDNTPYTSAVDYVREIVAASDTSIREVTLELYVIYLGTEPKVGLDEGEDPVIFEVVSRTLAVVGAASENRGAYTFDTINTFGQRAEQLGRALEVVLESYEATLEQLEPAARERAEADLRERARAQGQRGFLGEGPREILSRMSTWAAEAIATGLPLHVEAVKIYPETMPLGTLQFTERLGYRQANAVEMLTMGCYTTLDTLRTRLEAAGWEDLDEHDRRELTLARTWTGDAWQPANPAAPAGARPMWRCQRTACTFHARACRHGAAGGD